MKVIVLFAVILVAVALVLNMANGECLGGGFAAGIDGQEEELCRRTTLFSELAAMSSRHSRRYRSISWVQFHWDMAAGRWDPTSSCLEGFRSSTTERRPPPS